MKLLFIDHPEGDYLAAQLFQGLCRELGPENVVDWPFKRSYHGEVHRYPHPYPGHEGEQGVTAPFAWFEAQPGREWGFDEVCSRIGEFGLVVLASPRAQNTAALSQLAERVGRDRLNPLVMVDGEDSDHVRWDLVRRFWPRKVFKRELVDSPSCDPHPVERAACQGVVPVVPLSFSFGEAQPRPTGLPFDFDAALLGGGNRPGGVGGLHSAVRRVARTHAIGHVDYSIFADTLRRSRAVVVVRGYGRDTMRYWETAAVEGPMLFAERLDIRRVAPFVDGVHCAEWGSEGELEAKLQQYLGDEVLRSRVAASGFQHFQSNHTARERARYFLREALG